MSYKETFWWWSSNIYWNLSQHSIYLCKKPRRHQPGQMKTYYASYPEVSGVLSKRLSWRVENTAKQTKIYKFVATPLVCRWVSNCNANLHYPYKYASTTAPAVGRILWLPSDVARAFDYLSSCPLDHCPMGQLLSHSVSRSLHVFLARGTTQCNAWWEVENDCRYCNDIEPTP